MMLSLNIRAVADRFWAADIGCAAEQFGRPATIVAPPLDEAGTGGFVFARDSFTHINAPSDLHHHLNHRATQADTNPLDEGWWRTLIGDRLLRAIGPAYVGYADTTFAPVHEPPARLLAATDEGALRRFEVAVGATAWDHSGLEAPQPRAGCWANGELLAVAGYHVWGERIAHIGVAVHPAHRGAGYGKAVVSAIGRVAQHEGLLLQYRTLWSNAPSVAIATALGFQHYATTLALRLGS